MKSDRLSDRFRIAAREYPIFTAEVFFTWMFYLILAHNTPYGIDDWGWGGSVGIRWLIYAELNSRYVGNLLEIIVARYPFLKTMMIGTLEMLLPVLSVQLVRRWVFLRRNKEWDDRTASGKLLLANLIFLTIPREVWRQTFRWIAGFSNYGLAAVLLLVYQGILLDGMAPKKRFPFWYLVLCGFVGVGIQLVLENVTVFIMGLSI